MLYKKNKRTQDDYEDMLNSEQFSYNPKKDRAFKQYEQSYTRQAEQALDDTIAKVSARTDGMASSYAGIAGQQEYQRYMSALGDKIPQLQQMAYEMYKDAQAQKLDKVDRLMALDADAYAKEQDAKAFNYQVTRDRIDDMRYTDALEYERAWDKEDRAYERAQDKAQALRKTSTSGKKEQAYKSPYEVLYDMGIDSDDEVYAYLINSGYKESEIARLMEYYKGWRIKDESKPRNNGSSRVYHLPM